VNKPVCYQCNRRPARSLKTSAGYGMPVFCSMRCAAEAAYYEIGTRHEWCPIHQTWNHEDDLVLPDKGCPLCDIESRTNGMPEPVAECERK
jgi:hypothetical protein